MRRQTPEDTLNGRHYVLPVVGGPDYPPAARWVSAVQLLQMGIPLPTATRYQRTRAAMSAAGLRRRLRGLEN